MVDGSVGCVGGNRVVGIRARGGGRDVESCGGCVFRGVGAGGSGGCGVDAWEGDQFFVVGACLFAEEVLLREALPTARKRGAEDLLRCTCAEPAGLCLSWGIFGIVVEASVGRELVWE